MAKHLLYMVGVSFVILFFVFLFIKIVARQGKEYELPDFRGKTLQELKDSNDLRLRYVVVDSVYDADAEGGLVIQQDPLPGTMVKTRRKVYVTVTMFAPSEVVLPELSNMSVRSAVSSLEAAGLRCGRLRFVDSPYRNVVLECSCRGRQIYAGQSMGHGDVVDLVVGLGDGSGGTMIPFVIGQAPAKVHKALLSASLNVGREHFDSVENRSTAVCYRMDPDYTGVSRYPLGTYVELWYCEASQADVERIIANFKVDSTKIIEPTDEMWNAEELGAGDYNDWDW